MTSSALTVAVLAVLWLVVVVPMLFRRKDARANERSVARFGSAMRALTRRPALRDVALTPAGVDGAVADDRNPVDWVTPRSRPVAADVFVPRSNTSSVLSRATNTVRPAARRPVPAAREALMHPVDRIEMSAARHQMMARRRRSVTILLLGTLITLAAAFIAGGWLAWAPALVFLAALGGYVLFLRAQALRDRERRQSRLQRADRMTAADWDATEEWDDSVAADGVEPRRFRPPVETVVRIDDDDLELHIMDTVDLTGLYAADGYDAEPAQRRAG